MATRQVTLEQVAKYESRIKMLKSELQVVYAELGDLTKDQHVNNQLDASELDVHLNLIHDIVAYMVAEFEYERAKEPIIGFIEDNLI